jgi:hypothetical protein
MATKRKVKRFDEGGDARAGMNFAGTGSGLAGSGAADAAAGRGDANVGRNTGDASAGGGSREGSAARAGDSFAGTGSGLSGTGVDAARSGIGGAYLMGPDGTRDVNLPSDGPYLRQRVGDFVSGADFDKTVQKNNIAKNDFASLGLGIDNATQKYQLSSKRETDGTMVDDSFKNYTTPDEAQNQFNYQYDKLGKQLGRAKGGKVKAYAKGGMVSASSRGDGIAQRGKTKGRMC